MNMMTDLTDVKRGAVIEAKMRIAGKEVGGARVIEVRNPDTSALVGTVPKATVDDIRAAFAVARAYRAKLTRYERSEILAKAAALIRARAEAISDLITAGRIRAMKWGVRATCSRSPAMQPCPTMARFTRAT